MSCLLHFPASSPTGKSSCVPARRQRKPVVNPSDIPTLKGYTARLVDQKWLRLAARRAHG